MGDSLVVAGQIELLGQDGGVASQIPECAGAFFTLAPDYDLGSPQPVVDLLSASLLDGEIPTGRRSSNRVISLPVKIAAPDRDTLAAAREILLALTDQDEWILTWTRDGGPPMIYDCFRAAPSQPGYNVLAEQQLVTYITLNIPALPYGRSDEAEVIQFPSPSQNFDPPPAPVTVDVFGTPTSFLQGDASTFEGGIANWVAAGSCTIAQSATDAHGGTKSLELTATATSTMTAAHCAPANVADDPATGAAGQGMAVRPGDSCNVSGWYKWNGGTGAARTCQSGIEFFDTSEVSLGDGLFGTGVADSSAAYTQISGSNLIAPSGAAWARAKMRVTGTLVVGEKHRVDDVTLNRGPVSSFNDPAQWSSDTKTPVTGHKSAKWTRATNDYPVYDHLLPAAVNISGLTKWTFWLGLSTTAAQKATWHKGPVHFAVTLYDATGQSVSFSARKVCKASAVNNVPHWQLVSMPLKQVASGFDYTTLTRYSISAWNTWTSAVKVGGTQVIGQPVLQASAWLAEVIAAPTATGPAAISRGAFYTFPGIVGAARSPLALSVSPGLGSFSTTAEFNTAGSNAWSAPGGVTVVDKAEAWAAGGGGGGRNSTADDGGGGAGGGEYYAEYNIPVTALGSYPFTVGAAGVGGSVGNPGTPGGDSFWFGNGGVGCYANGGRPGWSGVTWGGGKGGTGGSGTKGYPGGNGHQSNANGDNFGGGGGGSGGTGAPGKDGDKNDYQGAGAVTGGGPGGDGGRANSSPKDGQVPPSGPGGGGGGGSQQSGSVGANGKVGRGKLTYGATGLIPLASLLVHAPGRDEPASYNPLVNLNDGLDIPNGSTEYVVPAVGALNARFDGSYTCMLVAKTWSGGTASSRTLTVVIKQIPFTSGTPVQTITLQRTVVPDNDLSGTKFYIDLGAVTLPLNALPAGNTAAEFRVTIQSSNTSDRFFDLLVLSSVGKTLLVDVPSGPTFNNMWVDAPDANRALGLVLGSDADRDRAYSASQYIQRYSGGPLDVEPGITNRLLVYAQQGGPGVTASYLPRWMTDRAV